MLKAWKYIVFLAFAIPAVYLCGLLVREPIAGSRWLGAVGGLVTRSVASIKPEASVAAIDPLAAAKVDEDLDYRIAERTKSAGEWREFLAAHPDGPHAQAARAELDRLALPTAPLTTAALKLPDPGAPSPPDAGAPPPPPAGMKPAEDLTQRSGEAAAPIPSQPRAEAAAPPSVPACKDDEDRLAQLSNRPTGDGVLRFLIELRCERLRPELMRLAERVEDKAPADAAQDAVSTVPQGPGVAAAPLPPPRTLANEPEKKTHPAPPSRAPEPKRHASRQTGPSLPRFLLALFGERPRSAPESRRLRADGGTR